MKKLAPVLAVCLAGALLGGAFSKQEPAKSETPKPAASDPAAKVEPKHGPTAAAGDPAKLPPAGTAPAPVQITKELDPMWDAQIKTLQGKDTQLAAYKGKALLLVNVASKCGLTPQYETLEALQKKYEPQGFTVIGFPCNQFKGQEPGSAEEIQRGQRRRRAPDLQGAHADQGRHRPHRRDPVELREVRGLRRRLEDHAVLAEDHARRSGADRRRRGRAAQKVT